MGPKRPMYLWRQMTPEQRQDILRIRQTQPRPWHGPPHFESDNGLYLVTAACFEHRPFIGQQADRMADFEARLLAAVDEASAQVFAWTVLPNHYHLLVQTTDVKGLLKELGRLHGRSSYLWNKEESQRGRQVWHRAAETAIKSEGHFWASLNYVLHNAVRHGYVDRWQDWPYCNAADYLSEVGREEAERRWLEYPLFDFGKDWDPPEL